MKNKFASTGFALLLIGAAMMDSDNIAIPLAIMAISVALIGAAAYLEWKEEHHAKGFFCIYKRSALESECHKFAVSNRTETDK